jgi:hypothetical protein
MFQPHCFLVKFHLPRLLASVLDKKYFLQFFDQLANNFARQRNLRGLNIFCETPMNLSKYLTEMSNFASHLHKMPLGIQLKSAPPGTVAVVMLWIVYCRSDLKAQFLDPPVKLDPPGHQLFI